MWKVIKWVLILIGSLCVAGFVYFLATGGIVSKLDLFTDKKEKQPVIEKEEKVVIPDEEETDDTSQDENES